MCRLHNVDSRRPVNSWHDHTCSLHTCPSAVTSTSRWEHAGLSWTIRPCTSTIGTPGRDATRRIDSNLPNNGNARFHLVFSRHVERTTFLCTDRSFILRHEQRYAAKLHRQWRSRRRTRRRLITSRSREACGM